MLYMSERKVDRIKKKFVLEARPDLEPPTRAVQYDLKIDGQLEAQLLALSYSVRPEGQAR